MSLLRFIRDSMKRSWEAIGGGQRKVKLFSASIWSRGVHAPMKRSWGAIRARQRKMKLLTASMGRQLRPGIPKLLVLLLRAARASAVCAAIWSINYWIGRETGVRNPPAFGAMMLALQVTIVWLQKEVDRWLSKKKR